MSKYVKISKITNKKNEAIIRCVEYIGKYYGNNRKSDEGKNIRRGKKYLAKKSRTSMKSVNYLMYGVRIKNRAAMEWRFDKKKYNCIYESIVRALINKDTGNQEEAMELLNELKERCDIIDNLSDVLVPKQKELLKWTEGKKVEEYEKNRRYIKSFLKNYDAMDLIYKKRIGN